MNEAQVNRAFQAIGHRVVENADLIRHWPLTGGVSASIDALELKAPTGKTQYLVVRRAGEHQWKDQADNTIENEYILQLALHQKGLPIAEQFLLDKSGEILPTPYAVMAMVDGTTDVAASNVESAVTRMADFLLRLHQLETNSISVPDLPAREDPVQGALTYVPDTPKWSALRMAIERWQITEVPASILHGDFWPGNVIWHDNQIAAVIDWEDAAIGTPVSDIACCRAEIMAMYGPRAVTVFTDHYVTHSTLDLHDQPLWDAYGGFSALATMHNWGLEPEVEAARRNMTELFVEQAAETIVTMDLSH